MSCVSGARDQSPLQPNPTHQIEPGMLRAPRNQFEIVAAIIPRTSEAGTTAFIIRLRRPGIIKANDDSAIMTRPMSPRVYQASARAFAGAGLRASPLPRMSASIFRAREAGTRAFMMRFSRPGTILERFLSRPLRPSDTHCSTLIGFIGMVFGSRVLPTVAPRGSL